MTSRGRDARIYCDSYQSYYLGRELGWQAFRCDERLDPSEFEFAAYNIEWLLAEKCHMTPAVAKRLSMYGFEKVADVSDGSLIRLTGWKAHRLFVPCCGRQFGSYEIYRRKVRGIE